jgi:hypothetical protein
MLEPNAGRDIALVWRASDPRETQFRQLADLLRRHAPAGVMPQKAGAALAAGPQALDGRGAG